MDSRCRLLATGQGALVGPLEDLARRRAMSSRKVRSSSLAAAISRSRCAKADWASFSTRRDSSSSWRSAESVSSAAGAWVITAGSDGLGVGAARQGDGASNAAVVIAAATATSNHGRRQEHADMETGDVDVDIPADPRPQRHEGKAARSCSRPPGWFPALRSAPRTMA